MAAALRRYRNEITGVALAYKRSAAAMPPLFLTRAAMPPAPSRDRARRTGAAACPRPAGDPETGAPASPAHTKGGRRPCRRCFSPGRPCRPPALARHGRADQSGGMAAALRRYRNEITGVALAYKRSAAAMPPLILTRAAMPPAPSRGMAARIRAAAWPPHSGDIETRYELPAAGPA